MNDGQTILPKSLSLALGVFLVMSRHKLNDLNTDYSSEFIHSFFLFLDYAFIRLAISQIIFNEENVMRLKSCYVSYLRNNKLDTY